MVRRIDRMRPFAGLNRVWVSARARKGQHEIRLNTGGLLIHSKSPTRVGCRRPGRSVMKALDEGRETLEIAIPRDERNALLTARCCDQRVIEQRTVFVEQL